MDNSSLVPPPPERSDLPTRLVAALIVPILLLAFVILFFLPGQTGQRFAWSIAPRLTAAFMGAGYLGGGYLFLRVALGAPWRAVKHGFAPVTAFTTMMLIATLLHWERFDLRHFPFQLWLLLYVLTPVLIPVLWQRNRHRDTGAAAPGDVTVPLVARLALQAAGVSFALFAVIGLVAPERLMALWVWQLSPLTARVLAGWFALLAVGGLTIGRERRWSAWRVGLLSIGIWHGLMLVGTVVYSADFTTGWANWYTALLAVAVAGMVALFIVMEQRARA